MIDAEEDLDESEANVLLEFCFADLYGANYGFRTIIEYDEECIEGVTCDATGESIEDENGNGRHTLKNKKGALRF